MTRSVETILLPSNACRAVKLEIDDAQRSPRGSQLVAGIDLRHGGVLVGAAAEWIPSLQRAAEPH
jgi:hypothetical protein